MKKITQKSILQKIITTIIVALLLSNFIVPTYSHADIGGVLMDPITDLICSVGDVVINLLQKCMTGDWGSDGFSLFKGGFLVDSATFFTSADYAEYRTGEKGEEIDPNDPDSGFNKTLLTGKTQDYYIPIATYSPEQIFTGNVAGLDINFIDPKEYKDKAGNDIESSAAQLQPTIAKWYVALRNLTIVGLLSVLVYVAIRIIISSTASDKAKYKQMLMDWLIALCIVFFLHYVMSFTLTLTQSICDAISGGGDETVVITVTGQSESFKTNLLGAARFKTQYDDLGQKVAYLIMYLALVIYTLIFTWFYLKRLLMMAFLTVVAPVVALTYPIDKMNDGKAQAFDSWLKEYIFNALIQPFHLIIYTVFVSSAMDLASTNIIYMIAALAFIMPAEKILRKFFGFEKAGAGTLGSLAGAAALGSLANKAVKSIGGGKGKSTSGGKGNQASEGDKPTRYQRNNIDINGIETPEGQDDENGSINFSDTDETATEETNIHDRAAQMLAEEEKNMTAQDYRERGMSPQEWRQSRQNELEEKLKKEQEQQQTRQQNNGEANKGNKVSFLQGMNNLRKYHNLTGRGIGNAAVKGIKGVLKFGTRTAFSAGAGTLAGAVALASGGGIGGAGAAFATASALGNRAANGVIGAVSNAPAAVRREIDAFNGNDVQQRKAEIKEWYKDENNYNYIRDKMTNDNGGRIPSTREVKEEMKKYDPYLQKDIRDIKDMVKAQKVAETYKIDPKDMATITALEKKDGVTKQMLSDKDQASAYQANLEHQLSGDKRKAAYVVNVMKERNNVKNNLKKPNQ